MKKTFKRLLAALLCASMLCGCAADEKPQNSADTQVSSSYGESTGSTSDITEDSPTEMTSGTDSSAPEEVTEQGDEQQPSAEQPESTAMLTSESSEQQEKPEQATASSTAGTTKPQTTAATTKKPTEKPQEVKEFSVDWKLSSTWEEGGKKCGGYEVTITNNTGSAVSGWTLTVTVTDGFELSSSWNGIFSISGKTLTVKNESYNGEIAAGGTANFGFNYRSPAEFTPTGTKVNGTAAGSGSSQGGSGGNSPAATTVVTLQTVPPAPEDPDGTTPVAAHGQLSVRGAQLVDENGKGYQLRGMSTHGITWFPDFVNENVFRTLRDDWNTNVVRLAMYVDEWGNGQCYMQNKDGSRQLLEKGVDICIKLGMYVIIDWHVLNPGDPSKYTDEAIKFFDDISKKYADYPNIIYEIANEPNSGAGWSDNIKPYTEKVIPVIRKNDKNAVIIVGTPTWSQDIDQALADPLDYDNVMYALHFYAATHTDWLRERTEKCITSGLPVFVSEFGCCDASGGGANDFGQAEKWLNLLDKYGVSYCNWSLANKAETCSAFKPSASANGNWSDSDYSEVGAWIRKWFRNK